MAVRRTASKQDTAQDATTPSSPSSLRMFSNLLRNPLFVLIFASPMLCGWSFFAPQSYVPQALADGGYSSSVGAGMVAAIGGVNMIGRVFQGHLLGTLNSHLFEQPHLRITGLSALVFWLSGPTHIVTVSLMAFFWGYANGGVIVALPIVAGTYFPPEHAGLVTGALFSGFFIPDMVGPIVAGAIVDAYTHKPLIVPLQSQFEWERCGNR
ncbi:MFS general substrate transporter [Gonapodya prolifera JEL478]|uniref:MFS general substrate transporter n=1 Tax=Gonapodya prolifera (strain JEL478) TaxID=1344416 RepID=A0A139AEV1_GONPJ|nr:MFS general substrate transporter [Gonapodya prolifera JEL478]|eukprot:KXS15280.1 MFS general substrate transporter [Gonapodya prolifera JEL478]